VRRCPICRRLLSERTWCEDTPVGYTTVEWIQECERGHYKLHYSYGQTEAQAGDATHAWSYSTPKDEVEKRWQEHREDIRKARKAFRFQAKEAKAK